MPKPKPKNTKLKKNPPKKLPYKGWRLEHGVSQSLLQKFIVDKDRAHKYACLGIREVDRKEAMEYGSIYHRLVEEGARMGDLFSRLKIQKFAREYSKRNNYDEKSLLLLKIALAQYLRHRDWDKNKPKIKYLEPEPVFQENFPLPAVSFNVGDIIRINIPKTDIILRGRIDGVAIVDGDLWLVENKTKSKIDINMISDTVPENIQVMFYAVAAELRYGKKVKGVIYNIIRKPGQRQKQKESEEKYVDRIDKEIEDNPNYYFYRLTHSFKAGAVEKWKREELIPLLYNVYMWWKSIEKNPTNPWEDEDGNVNPFHGRKSFGVYDAMTNGKGDYFDLIVHGRKSNYIRDYAVFPELEDD